MNRLQYPSAAQPRYVPPTKSSYRCTSDESSTSSHSSTSSSSENRNDNNSNDSRSPTYKRLWRPNCRPVYRPRVHPDPQYYQHGTAAMKEHPHPAVTTNTGRPSDPVGVPKNQTTAATATPQIPPSSHFVALDCEMVGVGPGGYTSSAARVTIVDWNGQILMDEYIRQNHPVTDYRTFVSGITEEHLQGATMTLNQCRVQVLRLLQNRILVGHALKNDLDVLGISHPWWLVRDTAHYEPFMQLHYHTGVLCPRKLKHLALEKLQQDIQVPGRPHSPYEDARAALDLYRSVQTQWESLVKYQIDRAIAVSNQQQRKMAGRPYNYVLAQ